ncbi:lysylphosphatidylglycerol synthase transmembrane domain-containing protein [Moorena sp. SIO3B2]|uniref:lysylphosphatidylglycerol synthase transmembrane domain-containing protein n=1 Tax=Moorena sp. SIO3B2 TaxID=2607827 RepID=UPI0013CCB4FE|nr:lysylphosphatidylglycerol synthase transmembrane domain-containing protein [Moorena sp. SIO3B2]NEP30802.1 flippase-like domain-containing protein [Moorena sp. SIO3B2]
MKRLISIAISLVILGVIYTKIDFPQLIAVFKECDRMWMAISLGMVIPITLFTAWRLQQLMPTGSQLRFWEANRLILAASTLNMVLPSKMGDIAKAYFMKQRGNLAGSLSLAIVIFEKACDMLSLLLWCVFGLLLYPGKSGFFWLMTAGIIFGLILGLFLLSSRKFAHLFFLVTKKIAPKKFRPNLEKMQMSWGEMHGYFWHDPKQLFKITLTSIFIWFLHLLQIWLFILALNAWTPFLANLALSPLAILAGLLPLTFAGVGTRDAALIFFYQRYFPKEEAAALGLLCTSRYLLPAIGGLPFLGQYLTTVRDLGKKPS